MKKKSQPPIPSLTPETSSGQLLERLERLCEQRAFANARAFGLPDGITQSLEVRKAIFYGVNDSIVTTRNELLHRLGVLLSPEITNRKAFLWLSKQTRTHACQRCGSKTLMGKNLDFWSNDSPPDPLPRMLAWGGASVERVEECAMGNCQLLCCKCAARSGGKITRGGKPYLQHYGVEIR